MQGVCTPVFKRCYTSIRKKAKARRAELVLAIPANPPLNQKTPVDLGQSRRCSQFRQLRHIRVNAPRQKPGNKCGGLELITFVFIYWNGKLENIKEMDPTSPKDTDQRCLDSVMSS